MAPLTSPTSPPLQDGDLLAAIDLGSNSFHMVVARSMLGQLRVVDRLRETVRIAHTKTLVECGRERALLEPKPYANDASRWVMVPANAKRRRLDRPMTRTEQRSSRRKRSASPAQSEQMRQRIAVA